MPNEILSGIRKVHPMFNGFHQHDTQEFLRFVSSIRYGKSSMSNVVKSFQIQYVLPSGASWINYMRN